MSRWDADLEIPLGSAPAWQGSSLGECGLVSASHTPRAVATAIACDDITAAQQLTGTGRGGVGKLCLMLPQIRPNSIHPKRTWNQQY